MPTPSAVLDRRSPSIPPNDEPVLEYVKRRLEALLIPRDRRQSKGERLDEVAKGSGVPASTIVKIVNGHTADPQISTIQALLDYITREDNRR